MRFTAISLALGFPAAHRTAMLCAAWAALGCCAVAAEPTAGRRTAEALPPGRFRTALLAELAVLDARRAPGAETDATAPPLLARPAPLPPPDAPPALAPAADKAPAPAAGPFHPPKWVDPFGEGMEEEADRELEREANRAAVRPVAAAAPALEAPVEPTPPAAPEEQKVPAPLAAAPAHTPGFGPYCPVSLRDERRLVQADPATAATVEGLAWHFATPAARDAFEADPRRYRPVDEGRDVVLRELEGFRVPGRPDRCVIYRDRLYLFASARSRAAFVKDPKQFARP